jgi:DnaJ-domain-containing protein 1
LKGTALLTRSYRTLKDQVARGLYWLELHGQKLAENNKAVPPELAALVFEVQEQLAELREAGEGRNKLVEEVRERRADVQQLMDAAQSELQENFEQWSAANRSADETGLIVALKKTLSKIAYLRTLLRDTDRELEPANVA